MSIVFASQMSPRELKSLGNNLCPTSASRNRTPIKRANTRVLKSVNRSLSAILDERVTRLRRRRGDDDGLSPVPVGAA